MFSVRTKDTQDALDITDDVSQAVSEQTGLIHVFTKHTTCAVTVNEHTDESVVTDVQNKLADLIPERDGYQHDRLDGNADAHIKASIIGSSTTIPVKDGELQLGRWQRVILLEFDGPRRRQVAITALPQPR